MRDSEVAMPDLMYRIREPRSVMLMTERGHQPVRSRDTRISVRYDVVHDRISIADET